MVARHDGLRRESPVAGRVEDHRLPEEEMGFMAAAADLGIIGVKLDSRDAADQVAERLDQMVDAGQAAIREAATIFKRPGGRVKVHHLHSRPVLIGAAALGVETGIGAGIGHAVAKHRRQESKAFLKSVGDTVQAGGAAVLVVCDPPNAEKLLAELRADYPGHETVDLSAAEKENIINSAREAVAAAS
jgi:uncharacterized membrane protein